ncbi:hypothetical protein GGR53DRAFT_494439 [Hypoxylon sp. FL1150]|nr:hypothetical protein GGR53DRAFT_494439 [Hypoxylon sp. FL1150]
MPLHANGSIPRYVLFSFLINTHLLSSILHLAFCTLHHCNTPTPQHINTSNPFSFFNILLYHYPSSPFIITCINVIMV